MRHICQIWQKKLGFGWRLIDLRSIRGLYIYAKFVLLLRTLIWILGFLWWVWFGRVQVYGVDVGRIARFVKLECRFPIYLTDHMVTLSFKYERLGGRCSICGLVNYVGTPCPQDHIRTTPQQSKGSLAVVSFCGPPFPFTPPPMVFTANVPHALSTSLFSNALELFHFGEHHSVTIRYDALPI